MTSRAPGCHTASDWPGGGVIQRQHSALWEDQVLSSRVSKLVSACTGDLPSLPSLLRGTKGLLSGMCDWPPSQRVECPNAENL